MQYWQKLITLTGKERTVHAYLKLITDRTEKRFFVWYWYEFVFNDHLSLKHFVAFGQIQFCFSAAKIPLVMFSALSKCSSQRVCVCVFVDMYMISKYVLGLRDASVPLLVDPKEMDESRCIALSYSPARTLSHIVPRMSAFQLPHLSLCLSWCLSFSCLTLNKLSISLTTHTHTPKWAQSYTPHILQLHFLPIPKPHQISWGLFMGYFLTHKKCYYITVTLFIINRTVILYQSLEEMVLWFSSTAVV